jgi:GTP-binding protein
MEVEFKGSYPSIDICPKEDKPEYAFIGRSNVGKSSLINMLIGKKDLAKVSGKPGKTRMLNFYTVSSGWNLVDLPGYGFALVSKTDRASFKKMIYGYLENRQQLINTFVLIDGNIPVQKSDQDFLEWIGKKSIPFSVVFTKSDKINSKEYHENVRAFKNWLEERWEPIPPTFITSAEKKQGGEAIKKYIEEINASLQ